MLCRTQIWCLAGRAADDQCCSTICDLEIANALKGDCIEAVVISERRRQLGRVAGEFLEMSSDREHGRVLGKQYQGLPLIAAGRKDKADLTFCAGLDPEFQTFQ